MSFEKSFSIKIWFLHWECSKAAKLYWHVRFCLLVFVAISNELKTKIERFKLNFIDLNVSIQSIYVFTLFKILNNLIGLSHFFDHLSRQVNFI
jgi:hypothetical protein